MRLLECMQTDVLLARRIVENGELGGETERFSEDQIRLRGSRIPLDESAELDARGVKKHQSLRLLLPLDAQANPGDGAWVDGMLFRILSVRRWSAHVEWICEAIE